MKRAGIEPMRWGRLTALVAFIALACGCATPLASSAKDASPPPHVGTGAGGALDFPVGQALVVEDLEGGSSVVSEAFPDMVLLVVFFTTYAVPFMDMAPLLNDLQQKHCEEGFSVLGVSLDLQPKQMLPPFVEEFSILFPVVVGDEKARNAGLTPLGRITEAPTFWLLDRRGVLVWSHDGAPSSRRLIDEVERVL